MLFKVTLAKIRVWQKKAILAHKNTAEMVGFFFYFFLQSTKTWLLSLQIWQNNDSQQHNT